MSPVKTKSTKDEPSFAQLMAEFEAITARFDTPDLDIESAVTLHAQGVALLAALQQRLTKAEAALTEQMAQDKQ